MACMRAAATWPGHSPQKVWGHSPVTMARVPWERSSAFSSERELKQYQGSCGCVDAALGSDHWLICLDSHSHVSSVFPGFYCLGLSSYPGLWKSRLLLLSGSRHPTGFLLFFHANPRPCADLPTLPCVLPPQAGRIFL